MIPEPAPIDLHGVAARSGLIGPDDHVLVAVSGGPDSMALLDVLATGGLARRVTAAHFDHRLRPDSARDRAAVERFAAGLGVPCLAGEGDVRARARQHHESIEQAARALRYAFLHEAADSCGATRIATGHTRDDQIETVLMRLFRHAGIRGLSGIPARRGQVVRPFLDVPRAATLAHCRSRGITTVHDPTNDDTSIARNDVRHRVLPSIRAVGAGIDDALLRLAAGAADELARVRRETSAAISEALTRESDDTWALALRPLARLDGTARYVLLADLLAERLGREARLTRLHQEAFSGLIDAPHPAAAVSLPGAEARREHGVITLCFGARGSRDVAPPVTARELPVPGEVTWGALCVRAEIVPRAAWYDVRGRRPESGGDRERQVAYFSLDSIAPPLVARAVREGDRIRPFGMTGHKKLSDVFIDGKVPRHRRANAVVVADAHEVLWVAGVTQSESTRITGATRRVVRVCVEPVG